MTVYLKDRVKQVTSTTGTGTITFSSTPSGYQSFSTAYNDGDEVYYVIENRSDYEIGIGTYIANTLSRDTVLKSTNGGAKLSLTGRSTVFVSVPAEKTVYIDGTGQASINLDKLSDVVIIAPASGQGVVYNGTNWVNGNISGYTDEQAQDAVAGMLIGSTGINIFYNDIANTLTIASTGLLRSSLNFSDLANVPIARTNLGLGTAALSNSGDFYLSTNPSGYISASSVAAGYQPLDGDLTSLAAATGVDTIYYRSATSTWSPVVIGTGILFSGGTLSNTLDLSSYATSTGVAALYTPLSRTITINGSGQDLTSNRSWTVGDLRSDSSYSDPTWLTTLAWSKISGTPTTISGYGITNAYTKTEVDSLVTGLLDFKGNLDCSANPNYPTGNKGDAYYVSVAGKIGGASGKSVDVGDMIIASADNAGGTEASVGTSWFVLEHNLVGALVASNNLSDLTSASTARSNLGLGSLATVTPTGTPNGSKFLRDDYSWQTIDLSPYLTTSSAATTYVPYTGATGAVNLGTQSLTAGTIAANGQFTNIQGTLTSSAPLTLTQTWNSGATTFTGLLMNVTNTASASASLLMDLQVGGVSRMSLEALSGKLSVMKANDSGVTLVPAIAVRAPFNATSSRHISFYGPDWTTEQGYIASAAGHTGLVFFGTRVEVTDVRSNYGTPNASQLVAGGLRFASGCSVGWGTVNSYDTPDLTLFRDAANTLGLRNSTNAQTFNIANTWTSATSFEYGRFQWSGNLFQIGTAVGSAGGTQRSIAIGTWNSAGAFQSYLSIDNAGAMVHGGATFFGPPSGWTIAADNASGDATLTLRAGRAGNGSGTQVLALNVNNVTVFNGNTFGTTINTTLGNNGLILQTQSVTRAVFSAAHGNLTLTPSAATSGSQTGFTFTAPAPTGQTASTEATMVNWNLASTVTFAAGALTTQRAFRIQAPTYAFASASTISTAITLDVSGPPIAGTNATITYGAAIRAKGAIAIGDGTETTATASKLELFSNQSTPSAYIKGGVNAVGYLGQVFNNMAWSNSGVTIAGNSDSIGYRWVSNLQTDSWTLTAQLVSPSANNILQVNGVNAQTFNIANTWTSSTSFEYGRFQWASNEWRIGTAVGSAGGTVRGIVFGSWNTAGTWTAWQTFSVAANGSMTNATFDGGTNNYSALRIQNVVHNAYIGVCQTGQWDSIGIGTQGAIAADSSSVNGAIWAGRTNGGLGVYTNAVGTRKWFWDAAGNVTASPVAATSGSQTGFLFTAPAATGQTASTEATMFNVNLASTVTFAAGALTTQRAFRIQAPTYAFASASTITTAATLAISGAPAAGTNATITTPVALWIESGVTRLGTPAAVGTGSNGVLTMGVDAAGTGFSVVSSANKFVRFVSGGSVHGFISATNDGLPFEFQSGTAILFSPTSNLVEQRNGTNAQTFGLYNTWTSATNFEELQIQWATNIARIGTAVGSVGGTQRAMSFGSWNAAGAFTTALTVNTTGTVTVGAYTLPATDGTINQVLQTNGAGVVSWATVSGGSGSPGGSDTQIQFNDAGAFGGSALLTFNKTTGQITNSQGTLTASAPLTLTQTWNNAAVAFNGMLVNVTNTASLGPSFGVIGSTLLDLQVGGSSVVRVRRDGAIFGSGSAPAVMIQAQPRTNSGWNFGIFQNNESRVSIAHDGVSLSSACMFGWTGSTSDSGAALDLALYRDAANTLGLRNGPNAQTFNIANTWTSSTSFEYGRFQWASNEWRLGTAVGSAGGTQRSTVIGSWNAAGTFSPFLTIDNTGAMTATGATFFGPASGWTIAADNASGTATLNIRVGRSGNNSGVQTVGIQVNASPVLSANNFGTSLNSSGNNGLELATMQVARATFSQAQGNLTLTPGASTSGSQTGFTFTAPAPTGQTASTEATMVNWNLASTVTFAAGALTTQRAFRIQAPTYSCPSAMTITNASTLAISGPPAAAGSLTITNPYALNVESGLSNFGGGVRAVDAITLFSSIHGTSSLTMVSGTLQVSGHLATVGSTVSFGNGWASVSGGQTSGLILTAHAGGTGGITLSTGGSNTCEVRNSTNAQTFRVYNTWTSATSNEFITVGWATNVAQIGTVKGSAGGSARDLEFQTDGTTRFRIVNNVTAGRVLVMDANGNLSGSGYNLTVTGTFVGSMLASANSGVMSNSGNNSTVSVAGGSSISGAVGALLTLNGFGHASGGIFTLAGATPTTDSVTGTCAIKAVDAASAAVTNVTGGALTIGGGSAGGSNSAGGAVTIFGGQSRGTGLGGSIIFQTAAAGTTGSTLNSLTTRLTIDSTGLLTFAEGSNIAAGTTTGSKIGTSATQKLGFWNATPVVQNTGWSTSNSSSRKTIDATATNLNELIDLVCTLVETLKSYGIIGA